MPDFDDVQVVNADGVTVGQLRPNPSTQLEDFPNEARFFGELSLSRPDQAAPSVRPDGLQGSLTLGIKQALTGALRLYSDDSNGTSTIKMSGSRLLLSAGHVVASSMLESVVSVARRVLLRDDSDNDRLRWSGTTGLAEAFDASGTLRCQLDTATGIVRLFDNTGAPTLTLDGSVGDVVLENADCAEDFTLDPAGPVAQPGMVVVLGAGGRVQPCGRGADTRVAGVISGAGRYRPGLRLDRQPRSGEHRVPVALMGKVCCYVDAAARPVRAGDRLTTGTTTGHAVSIGSDTAAPGAVLGKALGELRDGRGLVPVLVTLQ